NLDLPPSGIPFELPKLVDVTVPSVSVPWVDGAEGMTFDITVKIEPRQEMVAALAFSLDYDETCLDPDLDDYTFTVPQGFTTELEFDPPGASGEIAASIYDASPPIGALPAGDLLRLSFKVICSAPLATVSFSSVTFGDDLGQNLPGSGVSGGVRILSGLRGDCNGNGKVEVPDFTALGLEIDDGGGVFWADAIGGTFPGSPIGCDANANTEINAADLTCISEIISGRACAVARANRVALPTLASVTATAAASPGDLSWIGVRVEPNAEIGAMVLALDLDPAVFDLAALDGDGDGYADRVDYANGEPGFAMVRAHDGKLVVVLADRSRTPFPKGMLLEVGVPVLSPANPTVGLSISDAPPTSFGTVDGADMPGQAVIDNGAIFIDDFESGSTSNWSATVP
ncbi:MAG: hypothetical protein GY856_37285, partial [bacterium]|nr:hypothetical protein [bacterium]